MSMQLVSTSKLYLKKLRNEKWDFLSTNVKSFCDYVNIGMPDLNAPYFKRGEARNQLNNFMIEQHYRVDLFYAAIDAQLLEINERFSEDAMELLILSMALNPQNTSECFKIMDIYQLFEFFYPADFTSYENEELKRQLEHYEFDVVRSSSYKSLSTISELCEWLVRTQRTFSYNLVFRVIVLVLTLPVSTATTERSFSVMNIVKTFLRSKMEDEFLSDALMIYIERDIAKDVSIETIIGDFEAKHTRRVRFS